MSTPSTAPLVAAVLLVTTLSAACGGGRDATDRSEGSAAVRGSSTVSADAGGAQATGGERVAGYNLVAIYKIPANLDDAALRAAAPAIIARDRTPTLLFVVDAGGADEVIATLSNANAPVEAYTSANAWLAKRVVGSMTRMMDGRHVLVRGANPDAPPLEVFPPAP